MVFVIRELLLGTLEYRVTRWVLKEERFDLLGNYGEIFDCLFKSSQPARKAIPPCQAGAQRLETSNR